MKLDEYLKLYFITDSSFGFRHEELARLALEAGVRAIQFREKKMSTREMYETAKRMRKLTKDYSALFIVNDRLDIALASNADGVHVGQDDMPAEVIKDISDLILGVSVSNADEAIKAESAGANYLGAGPVFQTSTKEDAREAIGIDGLKEILRKTRIPVVAIGGINHSNAFDVLESGCAGIAVISAIAAAPDPKKSAEKMLKIIREFGEGKDQED